MAAPESTPDRVLGATPEADEPSLLRAAAAGDRAAWDRLVEQHALGLWQAALATGRGRDEAATACERAWRAVAQRLPERAQRPEPLGPALRAALEVPRRRVRAGSDVAGTRSASAGWGG